MSGYENTQPKPGHLSGQSTNPKSQPGMGDGTQASNAGDAGKDARSDNYPCEDSPNVTNRGSDAGMNQIPRGYVEVPSGAAASPRKVGNTIRKIKE